MIELIVKLSEAAFELLKTSGVDWLGAEHILSAVANGTPLPKGHGALKDTDKLIKDNGLDKATKYGNETKEQIQFSYGTMMMYEIFDLIDGAETIVEADKEDK